MSLMLQSPALAILVILEFQGAAGCCLESSGAVGASGTGATVSGPGSSTGGAGGTSGGSSTGSGIFVDAGACLINGDFAQAGTWWDLDYGSCSICDPQENPSGWTLRPTGTVCGGFLPPSVSGGILDIPIVGQCSQISGRGYSECFANFGGIECGEGVGCVGGFCGDAGWCVIDQNLGWFTSCGNESQLCAEGPCCPDAGQDGSWCYGLTNGGVRTCLAPGAVCYESSNCCDGLSCVGTGTVQTVGGTPISSDGGYGFCVPN